MPPLSNLQMFVDLSSLFLTSRRNWYISVVVLFTMTTLVSCNTTPRIYEDPRGDFSMTYSADWEETTDAARKEFSKRGPSDYQIAFTMTRYVVDDSGEGFLSRSVPAAILMIKRGSIPDSWRGLHCK